MATCKNDITDEIDDKKYELSTDSVNTNSNPLNQSWSDEMDENDNLDENAVPVSHKVTIATSNRFSILDNDNISKSRDEYHIPRNRIPCYDLL